MLRALVRRWRRQVAPGRLKLVLPAPGSMSPPQATARPTSPSTADAPLPASTSLARLCDLGLRGIRHCTLTVNRSTIVSFRGDGLRVHRTFVIAPETVLQAVVRFVN